MKSDVSVLLLEPQEAAAGMIRGMLGGRVRLFEAVNLDTALEKLAGGTFDVALADLDFPGNWGLKVLEQLRRAAPRTPVIALLGQDVSRAGELLAAGACSAMRLQQLKQPLLLGALDYALEAPALPRSPEPGAPGPAAEDARPLLGGEELPGQAGLLDHLAGAAAEAQRQGRELALVSMEICCLRRDGRALDAALASEKAAAALRGELRENECLAGLAPGRFALLAPGAKPQDLARRCAGFQLALRDCGLAGASMGLALFPADSVRPASLLAQAQVAMKQARLYGGACVQFYDRELQRRLCEGFRHEVELCLALRRGEFSLAYQPVFRLSDGSLRGAEALLRWEHPERGFIPPQQFIPLAEATGLIVEIGAWVFRQACQDLAGLQRRGHSGLQVAVNLSPRQFSSAGLLRGMQRAIAESGVNPGRLGVELTEGSALQDPEYSAQLLKELRAMGVETALDDFGTGFSALSQLRRLPLDLVKIDRSFVAGLGQDPEDEALCAAVVGLCRRLGLETVAEGVERPEQLEALKRMGCDYAQGFLLGRPAGLEFLTARLESGSLPPQAGDGARLLKTACFRIVE